MTTILTIFYMISLISLIFTTFYEKYRKYRIISKSATSFIFILLYLCAANSINLFMLAAVIFCFLGDVFLALQKNNQKTHMLHGIAAFLLAHIMYIAVMQRYVSFHFIQILWSMIGVLILKFITSQLKIELGKKKTMIYIYTFIIFLMNSLAISTFITQSNMFGYLLGIGGTLFVLSDMILLFLYFKYKNNLPLQISNSMTYYTAQYLMVISFMFI